MKKLVKRLSNSIQSVEAYCNCSCQYVSCKCAGGTQQITAGMTAAMESVNQSITAQTSSSAGAFGA